jgi:hypothetical protein
MTTRMLQCFCSRTIEWQRRPMFWNGHTYATNDRIAVRVPGRLKGAVDVDDPTIGARLTSWLWDAQKPYEPLPRVTRPRNDKRVLCKYTACKRPMPPRCHVNERREWRCPSCGVWHKLKGFEPTMQIAGRWARIAEVYLLQWTFGPLEVEAITFPAPGPIRLKFDGGQALLAKAYA